MADASQKTNPVYVSPSKRSGGPWDVIVVGSGMGGMACAAALSKMGKRVLVLEQHYVPGGFTHTFQRKGFSWDVGVHCVGEMGPKEMPGKLLRWLSNGGIEWAPMGSVYETFHFPDEFTIEFPDSRKKFKETLESAFPEEKEAIARYFELVREAVNAAKKYFALKTTPEWLGTIGLKVLGVDKWWAKTTAEVLDSLTSNARLKAVLTANWGYYGSTPSQSSFAIHAIVARHFWNGGYFPVGGSKSIADHLLKTVQNAGGQTVVRAPVQEIIVRNGRAVGVRLTDGEEILAPIVVSAAGAHATAKTLVPESQRPAEWSKEILKLKHSPSYVCLYIGFEGDVEAAGATKSNQWFFKSWDIEDGVWNLADPHSEAPVLYVSFPSLKDPHHVAGPAKKHTGEVVTFVPWESFEKWKDTRRGGRVPDYMAYKKDLEDRMMEQMRKCMPKLMNLTVYHELSTPLSTQFFTKAHHGAIYGLEATPERFLSPKLRTRTPIKGLYMAGGDIATLGVTGALIGGTLAASTISPRVLKQILS